MDEASGAKLTPLPRARYWPETGGPPNPNLERHLLADLLRPEYRAQKAALERLSGESKLLQDLEDGGIKGATLADLRENGLVSSGVNLREAQRTYKLTRLGTLVWYRLMAANRHRKVRQRR